MSSKYTHALSFECVPNVASPVVVASKEEPSRNREGNGGNAAKDMVMGERVEFSVSTDIKQSAGSIVGPSGEGVPIREEPGKQISASTWRQGAQTYWTALMSDSCPTKVCVAFPLRISQSLAVASQAPETNTFWFGPRDKLGRRGVNGQTR